MSHCTKFDFTYSDEEAIVLAFRKLKVNTSTETINESSDNTNRRVIDIEFTPEVVAELAQGSFIEANRSIDVF